ncbi:hypothetical protein OF389_09910 [Companilactobacillus farciminis]|nr:hypothetical protein [Companilactobacillus farciminis]
MKKLRNTLLLFVAFFAVIVLTACGPKVEGKYVADITSVYTVLNVKDGKGTMKMSSDQELDNNTTMDVTIKGKEIKSNGKSDPFKFDKDGNIILTEENNTTLYKADSEEGKRIIQERHDTVEKLNNRSSLSDLF